MPLLIDLRIDLTDPTQNGELRAQVVYARLVDPGHIEPADLPISPLTPFELEHGAVQVERPLAEHTIASDLVRSFVATLEANGLIVNAVYLDFLNDAGAMVRRDGIRTVESVGMRDGNAV